jgi:hypothetical protein
MLDRTAITSRRQTPEQGCRTCGFRSRFAASFRWEASGLFGRKGPVCFGCAAYQPAPYERQLFGWWLGRQAFWGLIAFWASTDWGWPFVAVAWATLVLCEPLDTLIHEAGHALAVRLTGFQLLSVRIGRGPEVLAARLGSTRFSLRRYAMLGGDTQFIVPEGAAAWRQALAFLGGPLASLSIAIMLIVLILARDDGRSMMPGAIAMGLVILGLRTGMNTLWPQTSAEGQPTDGAQLLALLKGGTSTAADPLLTLMTATERLQLAGRHDRAADAFADKLREWPNDPYLLGMMIHNTSRAAGDKAAIARYRALVAAAPAGPPRPFDWHQTMVGWLAANIAWSTIKSGPEADLEVADLELQTALERLPDAPEVKATLGALFVARGESEIGEHLLIEALRVIDDPHDRADFCRYIAKARRDRGDEGGAAEAGRLHDYILAEARISTS